MADSNEIRSHLIRMHVEPARSRNDYTVTIRAGDVVNEIAQGTAIPAVCGVCQRQFGRGHFRRSGG